MIKYIVVIICLTFTIDEGIAQSQDSTKTDRFEYVFQISHLKSNYVSGFSIERESFTRNFYLHNEFNYLLNEKLSLGCYLGYALTDHVKIEQLGPNSFGGEVKTKSALFLGVNSNLYIFPLLVNQFSNSKFNPYLTGDLGYFYSADPEDDFEKVANNSIIWNVGSGLQFNLFEKTALNLEVLYGKDFFIRGGFNLKF
jgi:hypothetical protein|tara:strand:- start:146 stop:736 length:591 start_codon:yes stop_codon:yes gene_type:complete